MTIKIIGAGFGRTGTTSLKAALEQLGFGRCYHMQEVMRNPAHAQIWQRATEGETVDWNNLFEGYQATVDWPGCTFYQELMDAYPDAKVLLSVRDPERWYESTFGTIYQIRTALVGRMIKAIVPHIRRVYRMVDYIWADTFENRFEDRAFAIDVFNRHNEAVQAYVPSDRLLVYSVKEGWDPLCEFLGVDVPETPFPHLNDKRRIQRVIRFGPIIFIAAAVMLLLLIGQIIGWLIGTLF